MFDCVRILSEKRQRSLFVFILFCLCRMVGWLWWCRKGVFFWLGDLGWWLIWLINCCRGWDICVYASWYHHLLGSYCWPHQVYLVQNLDMKTLKILCSYGFFENIWLSLRTSTISLVYINDYSNAICIWLPCIRFLPCVCFYK